jgi:putative transposase
MAMTYFHLIGKTHDNSDFINPLEILWPVTQKIIEELRIHFKCDIVAYILMKNHYHLIIKINPRLVSLFAEQLNTKICKHSREEFQRPYIEIIKSNVYLQNCYRYIYQNSRRAGLCLNVENYPFSTLFYLYRQLPLFLTVTDRLGFCDKYKLWWINK